MVIILKILFKNITKYDKETYEKFLHFHSDKFSLSYIFYTALVMIALFYCIAMQVIYHNLNLAIILCIILSFFFLWRFLHPISEVAKDFKSDKIQNKKEFTFLFYEKYFKVRNQLKYEIVKYSKLHKIFETDDFFYLYLDKTHSILVSKSGFIKGSSSEFSNFIKKKYWWKYKNIKTPK